MEQHLSAGGVFADVRMRDAFDKVVATQETRATKDEIGAYLREAFPPQDDRRERFLCKTCRDQDAFVPVWSQRAIAACLRGTLDDRKNRTTALMTCHCERGRARVGEVVKGKPKPFFSRCFDPSLDCLCRDPDSETSIEDLKLWCEEKQNERPANYEPAFDEWSA